MKIHNPKIGDTWALGSVRGELHAWPEDPQTIRGFREDGLVVLSDEQGAVHPLAVIPAPTYLQESGIRWLIIGDVFSPDVPALHAQPEAREAREFAKQYTTRAA